MANDQSSSSTRSRAKTILILLLAVITLGAVREAAFAKNAGGPGSNGSYGN